MKTKIFLLGLVTAALALDSGCAVVLVGAAAGAGAGTVVYIRGELSSNEAVTFDKALPAAQAGLKDMGFTVTETKKDAGEVKLTARGAGDKKIQVTLVKVSDTVTEIRIRVGTWGDENVSRQVIEKIKRHF